MSLILLHTSLASIGDYDQFSRKWAGYQPIWGKIRINGSQASVVSELSSPGNSGEKERKFRSIEGNSSAEFQREWKDLTVRIGKDLNEFVEQVSELGEG